MVVLLAALHGIIRIVLLKHPETLLGVVLWVTLHAFELCCEMYVCSRLWRRRVSPSSVLPLGVLLRFGVIFSCWRKRRGQQLALWIVEEEDGYFNRTEIRRSNPP